LRYLKLGYAKKSPPLTKIKKAAICSALFLARFRLKAIGNISGYSPANQVILQAMKTYGLILADNGSNMYISGAPDSRWNDEDLNALKNIFAGNFEMIQLGYASEPSTPGDTQAPSAPKNLRILGE
jgi:hypothetical protein